MTSTPARPIPILINKDGGTARAAGDKLSDTMKQACADAGVDAEIQLLAGRAIADAVTAVADQPLVIVGGGDGTLRSAAASLLDAKSNATLGLLPLGTHNHLAKQLDIPLDLTEAVRIAAKGRARLIDVGSVNGTIFLNNASIGLYPELVESREEQQERHGIPKWIANMVAARTVLQRLKHHNLSVAMDGKTRTIRTPLLFVGNNVYSLEGGHVGTRQALDQGVLSVFAVASTTRLTALWFAARTLVGRADADSDFAALATPTDFTVSAHAHDLTVALDGEVETFATPLDFAVKPLALGVMGPAEG